MFSMFPKGVSVVTVVILGIQGTKIVPIRKVRVAKSQLDMVANFPMRTDGEHYGEPVLGSRVYRERTKAEIKAAGLTDAPYMTTLVPLSNCGEPYFQPQSAAVAA